MHCFERNFLDIESESERKRRRRRRRRKRREYEERENQKRKKKIEHTRKTEKSDIFFSFSLLTFFFSSLFRSCDSRCKCVHVNVRARACVCHGVCLSVCLAAFLYCRSVRFFLHAQSFLCCWFRLSRYFVTSVRSINKSALLQHSGKV